MPWAVSASSAHCVLSFVSQSLETWEQDSPDSFAFSVLAVVYVLPVRRSWQVWKAEEKPKAFAPFSSGSVGKWMYELPVCEFSQWPWCSPADSGL